jgi:hypothetical protein
MGGALGMCTCVCVPAFASLQLASFWHKQLVRNRKLAITDKQKAFIDMGLCGAVLLLHPLLIRHQLFVAVP